MAQTVHQINKRIHEGMYSVISKFHREHNKGNLNKFYPTVRIRSAVFLMLLLQTATQN